ncbi:TVP38/TMEM64 family protein [Aquiflexum lacus]|uniref:TVP38/TMEM64 family protein n=1 Tax=Aquiflexum lacus TaxID=2483805 RepID=UPI0018948F94|nr:VTT domain-containing protein [Aquiflexum lacus]
MRAILKIIFILTLFFASTFLIARFTGIFSLEDILEWLEKAQEINPIYLFILVVLILFIDLFIAIPTLTVTVLSGHFLGFGYGGLAAVTGMLMAGIAGYTISKKFGDRVLKKIVPIESKRKEAIISFNNYGTVMILLSRVSPILPEVSACLAGMTGMDFRKFLQYWCLNTMPYALIASYSGSISSLNNPNPAIYASLSIYAFLGLGWYAFRKYKKSNEL